MKVKNAIQKVGAVAGSALMVGMTAGAAASLADFPQNFVDDDGQVHSQIVVGDEAMAADIVGAINVASAVGQNAVQIDSETQTIETEGGVAGWSAENGVTLNRENSNLFLGDATDEENTRFDEEEMNILETTSFQSVDNEDVEVEYEVNVGEQHQNFNAQVGDLDDPALHVELPSENSVDADGNAEDYLFTATSEFDETMDFTAQDMNNIAGDADEVLESGDEFELFGQQFTYSDESSETELVLYGASERVEVNTGSTATITTENGEEVDVGATYVGEDGLTATITTGSQTDDVVEGDSVGSVGNIRVEDIFRTGPDGQGRIAFAVGSQEINIHDDGDVEADGQDVDGVDVSLDDNGDNFEDIDGMTFAFGATDSDEDYIPVDGMYEDPVFGSFEFHYGGLSPDAADSPAETVEVTAQDDDTATLSVTSEGGSEADINFANVDESGGDALAFDENEEIATHDGQTLETDDYFVLNQNEEAAMFQVTDIDNADLEANDNDGEISLTVENVFTGESETVEEDGIDFSNDDEHTLQDESVGGMDFDVTFNDDATAGVMFTDDDGTNVYPALYTQSDAAVAFMDDVDDVVDSSGDATGTVTETLEFPSTTSSGTAEVDVVLDNADDAVGTDGEVDVTVDGTTVTLDSGDTSTNTFADVQVGGLTYDIIVDADDTTDETAVEYSIDVDPHDAAGNDIAGGDNHPAAAFIQPEDDDENEEAFTFEPDVAKDQGSLSVEYTGTRRDGITGDIADDAWAFADMDSEDNVEVGYTAYGTYTSYDTDDSDQETFTLDVPGAQSTSGLALTGTDGDLSSTGGAGSVEYTTETVNAQTLPDMAALDSEVTESVMSNNHLILVGGPIANSLTQEIAQQNENVSTADEWENERPDDVVDLHVIEDAFSDGQDAMIIAGAAAEDTREGARYISQYREHQSELEDAGHHLTLTSADYPSEN